MKDNNSLYPQDWFRIGEKEFNRAENLLKLGDLEGAGFNIQQSLEKYLKGFLLGHGWELRRIHNLVTLLNEAMNYDPGLDEFRSACQRITQYYVEERYPSVVPSKLEEDEIRKSLDAAQKMIKKILEIVEKDKHD